MMRTATLILVLLVLSPAAHAAQYWVSQAGGVSGVNGNCTQIDGTDDPGVYMTPYALDAANCAGPGDTVMFKAGIYTGAALKFNLLFTANGTPFAMNKVLCEGNRTCDLRTAQTFGIIAWIENTNNFVFGQEGFGFKITCNPGVVSPPFDDCGAIGLRISSGGGVIQNVLVEGNHLTGCTITCWNQTERQPIDYFRHVTFRKNRVDALLADLSTTGDPHPTYCSGDECLLEYNEIYATFGVALHDYHMCSNSIWRYNRVTHGPAGSGWICTDSEQGRVTNAQVYGNTFKWTGAANAGACLLMGSASKGNLIYNNVCDGHGIFIRTNTTVGATAVFKNNVCTNGNCVINLCANSGSCTIPATPTQLDCGGAGMGQSCTTNNPIVTAASHFKDAANQDYSLIAGSTLINAGLSTGGIVPANGAKDRGAHETFTCNSASINNNLIDLTCNMAGNGPIQPLSGATGWSIGCTGTNCGTPVINTVALAPGTSTQLRFTLTGIGGGSNACAAGQTWTLTYNAATGNVRDSAKIGWFASTGSQHLHSFGPLTITNICTGGGSTPPPAGLHVYHKLDGNANDSSGNGLTGTVTGGSFLDGLHGQAFKTTAGTTDSVQLAYGNGVDPFTQPLTIAGGFFVEDGLTNSHVLFGAPLTSGRRLYLWRSGGSIRLSIQGVTGTTTEFGVQVGSWHHACMTLNAGTATLYVNGVAGVSSGAAVLSYTSFTFSGNFFIGQPTGFTTNGNHRFDEWQVWTSIENCTTIYNTWNPPPVPVAGVLKMAHARAYGARLNSAGALIPAAGLNTTAKLVRNGALALAIQTDCDNTGDCTAIGQKLWYTCALCPSAGTELPVPDTAGADGIEFWGGQSLPGLLTGAHGANLNGALTHVAGETLKTSDTTPVFDLAQNNSTVQRYIVRATDATPIGATFKFFVKEQSGIALTSVNPTGGLGVTIEPANASLP